MRAKQRKSEEDAVEFLEPGEDAAVTFETAEEALDFIALFVEGSVITPGINAIGFGRDHRNHIQREHELTCFIAFISSIHDHGHARERPQIPE
jgi:hypothetical protein